jgi:chemotaxis protein histidine kinase CheA
MTESFDLSGLLDEFRDEARGQLDRLDAALLSLERDGRIDEEESAALLRGLHTLKGNAGMLGYIPVRDYVHAVESVFKAPPEEWTQSLLDTLFEGSSALRQAIDRIGTDGESEAFSRLESLRRLGSTASEHGVAGLATTLGPRFRGGVDDVEVR